MRYAIDGAHQRTFTLGTVPENGQEEQHPLAPGLITDDGSVTVPSVEEFLRTYMKEFDGFIQRVYMAIPRSTGRGASESGVD